MKNYYRFYVLAIVWIWISTITSFAQGVNDPFLNTYKIGGSSEFYFAFSDKDSSRNCQGIMDVNVNLSNFANVEDLTKSEYIDFGKITAASGDFNNDKVDDIVSIRYCDTQGVRIVIPVLNSDLTIRELKTFYDTSLNNSGYSRIRICTGNFDTDLADEFALAFDSAGSKLIISVFETDTLLNIKKISSVSRNYTDRNFDINSGDIDGDEIHEIVGVQNNSTPTNDNKNYISLNSDYDLFVLKLDTNKVFYQKTEQQLKVKTVASNLSYLKHNDAIPEMRIACGNLNGDNKDEVIVGWSFYYCYKDGPYEYRHLVFLNTFDFQDTTFNNIQNFFAGGNNMGRIFTNPSRHIALTLKCEQLDNIGADEVLVNSSALLFIFGTNGSESNLENIGTIVDTLNIKGFETFTVADLNPDTTKLDFKKEIIVLISSRNYIDQINNLASKTSLRIYSFDTISDMGIEFNALKANISLPFNLAQNSDIHVSAFVAGDFDINDAEVFYVGAPEQIESDITQPVIILNSPPVHFDVFDGVSYDLCNAYNTSAHPFYVSYSFGTKEENESSINVDKSWGTSLNRNRYAMYGGIGFETKLTNNWNHGNSYYNSSITGSGISQDKEIYKEDYIKTMNIRYNYYRYPVYNHDLDILGYIAVLSPQSKKIEWDWVSANSFEHPAYTSNHEVGNILSYAPIENKSDFLPEELSDIQYYDFDPINVSNTSNGKFRFDFSNISKQSKSFNYSSSVGKDKFWKLGVERTITAGVSLKVFEYSNSMNVRVGISHEISELFSNSTLSTHSTTITDSFKIEGYLGNLDVAYDVGARFKVIPYIYRSQSGALVLDYTVKLDDFNRSWWETHYGLKPDLAFILPWRYATEKGNKNVQVSTKERTNEIKFFPPVASPGDTVRIAARIHNYSLKGFDGFLKVDFYMGDPLNGGVKLTNIQGETQFSKYVSMNYGDTAVDTDFEEYVFIDWIVPETLACSPRIYAVIDPENQTDEIHENNNSGWNNLLLYSSEECKYTERISDIQFTKTNPFAIEANPNPFNSNTMIRFSLSESENVKIELFDMCGRKIETITDKFYPAGDQYIAIDASYYEEGIYFCRIASGINTQTIKLIRTR